MSLSTRNQIQRVWTTIDLPSIVGRETRYDLHKDFGNGVARYLMQIKWCVMDQLIADGTAIPMDNPFLPELPTDRHVAALMWDMR